LHIEAGGSKTSCIENQLALGLRDFDRFKDFPRPSLEDRLQGLAHECLHVAYVKCRILETGIENAANLGGAGKSALFVSASSASVCLMVARICEGCKNYQT
jgi:hypothetical protein